VRTAFSARLAAAVRSPLFWILFFAALMRAAGLVWGLPAADGWDDDGVAPRNFLVGLIQTYSPGSHFAYPPLHMFILALLTLPGWIVALFQAPALNPHAVIAEIIHVPYMTFFAVVARIVSIALSLATIALIGKMAERIGGKRAGYLAAAAAALNAALVYYGQVSNLDGPYLFWSALSLWLWMGVFGERDLRRIRWAMLAAAAAVASKDQAAALFLLSLPVALAVWFAVERWPRQNATRLIGQLLLWGGLSLLALLLVDGALTNPAGFAGRIAFLTGPASGDYAEYQASWSGRLALLADMWANAPRYYPQAAILLAGLGIGLVAARPRQEPRHFLAALLPLLAVLSFTLAFNFTALRTETRFLLPQSLFLAVYMGLAADRLVSVPQTWLKRVLQAALLLLAGFAFLHAAAISAAFIVDPRYDAERWLGAHVQQGVSIETYGLNAYLPRFPAAAAVSRVGLKPLKTRNPLPGVREVVQPYDAVEKRQPRYIAVSGWWVRDYLEASPPLPGPGRSLQKVRQADFRDRAARRYFQALFAGKYHYRLAHTSVYSLGIKPPLNAYESLAQAIYLFERVE
jgi:4-amino-4-deoxy-L-arabinose transferase-like glycosyltransferase